MNRELIEKLAREAHLTDPDLGPWMIDYGNAQEQIERFAALIAEECAKLADDLQQQWRPSGEAADAIRAAFKL